MLGIFAMNRIASNKAHLDLCLNQLFYSNSQYYHEIALSVSLTKLNDSHSKLMGLT